METDYGKISNYNTHKFGLDLRLVVRPWRGLEEEDVQDSKRGRQ